MNTCPELDPDPDHETDEPTAAEVADGLASFATLTYATTIGVFELVDRFRFTDPADPIPAPGADDIPDLVRGHAFDAMHAAASTHLADDDEHAAQALQRTFDAADRARRALWQLARIGLGVAQHAYESDDVELVERAMLGVLLPADADGASIFDIAPLVRRRREEVSVELAGLIAHAIVEQSADPTHPLALSLRSPDVEPITVAVSRDGVTVDGELFAVPVTIVEVTGLILSRIAASDPTAITRIVLEPVDQ